jgi:betaine-aldehyde dehydrogenase
MQQTTCANAPLFDHLVGASQQRRRHVEVGFVWIKEVSKHFVGAPFGGYKQSGVGREEGIEELLSFTHERNIHINRRSGAH